MSTRIDQKLRTRAALLRAASELVAEGKSPSVAEVAESARVSTATAYRYFPTQQALLVEVPLDEAAPTVASLFGPGAPADAEDRAALVQNALYDLARDHEAHFRLFLQSSVTRVLRGSQDARDPFRGARREALLTEALAPLVGELPEEEIERLKIALAALVGVESMVVFRDVMGLEHDQARAAGEWAVRQMVQAVRTRTRTRSTG